VTSTTSTRPIEWETNEQRIERCDHEGTTEPLAGLASVSTCSACATWPTRFGRGAPTVRIVAKCEEAPATRHTSGGVAAGEYPRRGDHRDDVARAPSQS
jgi:hypothetical protein